MSLTSILLFAKDGLKGAAGSKNAETDKSPVKDGDTPPPKPVSSAQLLKPFVLLHLQEKKNKDGKDGCSSVNANQSIIVLCEHC
jgi:hypothetical protein